jgi:hypothetical protein
MKQLYPSQEQTYVLASIHEHYAISVVSDYLWILPKPPTILEMIIPGHLFGFSTHRRRDRLLVMVAQQYHYSLARCCNEPNIGLISNIAHRGYCVEGRNLVKICRKW